MHHKDYMKAHRASYRRRKGEIHPVLDAVLGGICLVLCIGVLICLVFGLSARGQDTYLDRKLAAAISKIAPLEHFVIEPAVHDEPFLAARFALGMELFHDENLLLNVKVAGAERSASCASCHNPELSFYSGVRIGIGEGGLADGTFRIANPEYAHEDLDVQEERTPGIVNIHAHPGGVTLRRGNLGSLPTSWNFGIDFLPDGELPTEPPHWNDIMEIDGLTAQALHGGAIVHRMKYDTEYLRATYGAEFRASFPHAADSDQLYSGIFAARAIAYFEECVRTPDARFQQWLREAIKMRWSSASSLLSYNEKRGGILFFGKARCAECHEEEGLQGGFAAIGSPGVFPEKDKADIGRMAITGIEKDKDCHRIPGLYNLGDDRFYLRGGTVDSIEDAIWFHLNGEGAEPGVIRDERVVDVAPLSNLEVEQITDFIKDALYDESVKEKFTPKK